MQGPKGSIEMLVNSRGLLSIKFLIVVCLGSIYFPRDFFPKSDMLSSITYFGSF